MTERERIISVRVSHDEHQKLVRAGRRSGRRGKSTYMRDTALIAVEGGPVDLSVEHLDELRRISHDQNRLIGAFHGLSLAQVSPDHADYLAFMDEARDAITELRQAFRTLVSRLSKRENDT